MGARQDPLPPQGYRQAFRQAPVGLAVLDPAGVPLAVNDQLRTLLGPDARQEVTRAVAGRLPEPGGAESEPFVLGPGVRARLRAVHPAGDPDDVLPAPDDACPPGAAYLLLALPAGFGDDPLTGLLGRSALLDRLGAVLARREREHVELVVVDLDDFKQVNDEYGHLVGDEVLLEAACRLAATVRPQDSVYRWGGDEFVVLLTGTEADGGRAAGERLGAVLSAPYRTRAGELAVAASWGAVAATAGDTALDLLHRADRRMYDVKRTRKKGGAVPDLAALTERVRRSQARSRELQLAVTACQERIALARGRGERPRTVPARGVAAAPDPLATRPARAG